MGVEDVVLCDEPGFAPRAAGDGVAVVGDGAGDFSGEPSGESC